MTGNEICGTVKQLEIFNGSVAGIQKYVIPIKNVSVLKNKQLCWC